MPFRELPERVFNRGIYCSPISHFRVAHYMIALHTKDEPLPLGTKDCLGESLDIKNRCQSI